MKCCPLKRKGRSTTSSVTSGSMPTSLPVPEDSRDNRILTVVLGLALALVVAREAPKVSVLKKVI